LPTFLVSQFAREHVTVALSGDGSDETCGGYDRYVTNLRLHSLARAARPLVPAGLRARLANRIGAGSGVADKALKAAYLLTASDEERHYYFMSYFRSRKRHVYGPALAARVPADGDARLFRSHLERLPASDPLRRILYLDAMTYLPDDILYKVDIASMASSLEVRVPFLDHRLVEVAASVPSRHKVAGGVGKLFLKRIMERRVPKALLHRRKKGFAIPVSSWFRRELASYVRDTLVSSPLLREPWFSRPAIERLLREHQEGRADRGAQLWILMALALWHRKCGGAFGE
jgi:asparagine synthase (glutamine-hydrolysing)